MAADARSAEIASLVARLESDVARLEEGDASVTLTSVDSELREAEALVAQFDVTARGTGDDAARSAARLMRSVLGGLKDRVARYSLVGRPSNNAQVSDYHDDFIAANAALDRSTDRLVESRRTLLETEDVANGIGQDLLEQRRTIESARDKLVATGGMFGRAHRAMRMMERRDYRNKVCIYVGVGVVVLALFAAIIRVLAPRGSSPTVIVATLSPTAPTLSPTVPSASPTTHIPTTPATEPPSQRRHVRRLNQAALM